MGAAKARSKPQSSVNEDGESPAFETSIGRLEEIVGQMEAEKLPLEQLIRLYEEGVKLVKVCSSKLDEAEKRIQMISRKSDGTVELEDFEPAAGGVTEEEKPPRRTKESEDSDEISLF